jgi:hypothetical protein
MSIFSKIRFPEGREDLFFKIRFARGVGKTIFSKITFPGRRADLFSKNKSAEPPGRLFLQNLGDRTVRQPGSANGELPCSGGNEPERWGSFQAAGEAVKPKSGDLFRQDRSAGSFLGQGALGRRKFAGSLSALWHNYLSPSFIGKAVAGGRPTGGGHHG